MSQSTTLTDNCREASVKGSSIPQRVQLRMRGVRFETSVSVLSTYCGSFKRFFDLWRDLSNATRERVLERSIRRRRDAEEEPEDGGTRNSNGTDTIASMFIDSCLPADAPFKPPIREATLLQHSPFSKVPPKDASGLYWFWDFSVLRDVSDVSTSATGEDAKHELQPEFAGMIFVFLRKSYEQRNKQKEAPDEEKKAVKFSARWAEMPFDQQRSLCDIVHIFDIPLLKEMGYSVPTAEPVSREQPAQAAPPATRGGGYDEDRTMVDKALEYMAIQQEIHRPSGTGVPHLSVADDTLELPASGCARCGTSGHPTEACPY